MMEVRPPRRDHSDRTLLIYAREETAAVVAENVVCCVVIPPLPLLSLFVVYRLWRMLVLVGSIKMVLINMEE